MKANSDSGLPTFKDQARSHQDEHQPPQTRESINADGEALPTFKDQVRENKPAEPSINRPSSVVSNGNGNSNRNDDTAGALTAEVVDETSVVAATSFGRGDFLVSRRQVGVVAAVILLVVAAIVGGVCGSGNCKTGSESANQVVETDANATTVSPKPTLSPTAPPTIGEDSESIVNFVGALSLADKQLAYPYDLDSATPEQLAIYWLIREDPLKLSTLPQLPRLIQRYAILTFWYALSGPTWKNNTGWLVAEDECSWSGITCTNGSITVLNLPGNGLDGSIPPDLGLLGSLTVLLLDNNPGLIGSIPSSLGELRKLTSFKAENCALNGSIPETVGHWQSLERFEVEGNSIEGTIPMSTGNWTNLLFLNVGSNRLTGTLPVSASLWTNLYILVLMKNSFSGLLPDFVGNWTNLLGFVVSENSFSGTLPEAIGAWTNLQNLDLSNNAFLGSFPSSTRNWEKMQLFR